MTDRRALRLLGASVAALPLLTLLFVPIRTIDDAFITFRYARNLASGNGLVFNLGERVEGATSLSWTLLLAAAETLRLPIEAAALVLGVSFAVLALREAYLLGRRLGASPAACLAAVALVAVHGRFWLVAANGLEGGLFALLVVLVVRKTVEDADGKLIGGLLGLLFLTRPESLAILPIVIGYQLLGTRTSGERSASRRPAGVTAAAALAIIAAVTIWRLGYYGALLPNSVAAKSALSAGPETLLANLISGVSYTVRFEIAHAPFILGAAIALVLRPKNRALWLSLLVVASEIPAVLVNGGDWMPHYRLYMVFVPVLAAPLALCLSETFADWDHPGRRRRRAVWSIALLTLGAAFMLSRSPWQSSPGPRFELHPIANCYQFMATRLEPYLEPDDIAASEAIGLFGWVLQDTTIHDPLGLVDTHHARHGEYHGQWGKTDYNHLHQARPAVLVLHEGSVVTAREDRPRNQRRLQPRLRGVVRQSSTGLRAVPADRLHGQTPCGAAASGARRSGGRTAGTVVALSRPAAGGATRTSRSGCRSPRRRPAGSLESSAQRRLRPRGASSALTARPRTRG